MRSQLNKLRTLREELQQHQPPEGLAKWSNVFKEFRMAGEPRGVSVARKCVLLADMSVDKVVDPEIRKLASMKLEQLRSCASMLENTWLNTKELEKYLVAYRAQGYQTPQVESWEVDYEKPYLDENHPALISLWRVITNNTKHKKKAPKK